MSKDPQYRELPEQFGLYTCSICGSAVSNKSSHTAYHRDILQRIESKITNSYERIVNGK